MLITIVGRNVHHLHGVYKGGVNDDGTERENTNDCIDGNWKLWCRVHRWNDGDRLKECEVRQVRERKTKHGDNDVFQGCEYNCLRVISCRLMNLDSDKNSQLLLAI